jgi:hypothetical protein
LRTVDASGSTNESHELTLVEQSFMDGLGTRLESHLQAENGPIADDDAFSFVPDALWLDEHEFGAAYGEGGKNW